MKLPSFNPYLSNNDRPIGLARYFDTLFTNIAPLLLCNLLFILCCLPVVTAGPALIALNRVACKALQHKSIHIADFWDAFKKNFSQGILITFTLIPLLLWTLYLCGATLQCYLNGDMTLLPFCGFLVTYFSLCCYSIYLLPMLAYMNSNFTTVLKNAFFLCFVGSGYTIGGGISTAIIFTLVLLYLPKSLPLILLIYFSLTVYNACFFAWKTMDREIFQPYYEQHPEQAKKDHYTESAPLT